MANMLPHEVIYADMVTRVKALFDNHKNATSLDFEYNKEIYDFLVRIKLINLSKEDKKDIYEKVIRLYCAEKDNIIQYGSIKDAKKAISDLYLIKINEPKEEEKQKIIEMCRVVSIKECFNKLNYLNI